MVEKKKNWFRRHWIISTIGGIFLFLFLIGMFAGDSNNGTSNTKIKTTLNEYGEEYEVDVFGACYMAQEMIKKQLKAPSTAKFESCPTDMYPDRGVTVKYFGNQTYEIYTYVDAQNSFGAMTRTDFWVRLVDKGETWHLEDIISY